MRRKVTDLHRAPLLLVAATRTVLANGLGCSVCGCPSGCDRRMIHEAGWAHAPTARSGPAWLREAADPTRWRRTCGSRPPPTRVDGDLVVGGVPVADLVAEHNTLAPRA